MSNSDPLGILRSLRSLTGTPQPKSNKPGPRRQALINRLAAVGKTMYRDKNGWRIGGDWSSNLYGVEDLLREYESKKDE
jgi:hypothetical protein